MFLGILEQNNGNELSRRRSQARHAKTRTATQQPSTTERGACSASAGCGGCDPPQGLKLYHQTVQRMSGKVAVMTQNLDN